MFSSFKKKKEDDFSLNENSLPSLSDSHSIKNQHEMSNSDMPSFPPQNGSENSNSLNSDSSMSTSPIPEGIQQDVGGFNMPKSENNNSLNNDTTPSFSSNNDSIGVKNPHNEINDGVIKAKLESVDNRTELIEARLSAMEQKLEFIYQMISHEVSDETKQKLKVRDMVNDIKNN